MSWGDDEDPRTPLTPRYANLPLADFVGPGFRARALAALDLVPGASVVHLGYGLRAETPELTAGVGPDGSVVSLDLAEEISGRPAGRAGLWASYRMPVPDHQLDRVLADRVLQHIDDALRFFAELRRVLGPGGVAVVVEPDWESLVIDPVDTGTNLAFQRFVSTTMVRNATFGRQVARLAHYAGFRVRDVFTAAPVLRDFAVADEVLGLSYITERAVRTGRIRRVHADNWLRAMREGPFLSAGIIFTTVLEAPGGPAPAAG